MKKIPFVDLQPQYETIKDDIDQWFKQIFEKGNFILGEEVQAFEEAFAGYSDASYAVGVNSGTDALYLALTALDIGPGDEVIIPTFTFIATALCISRCGAKVVFVDVDEQTFNLDPNKLEAAITDKTKAVIPVHIYGQPADMAQIQALCGKHGLAIVEDAAQSHGATYQDKKVGALGKAACFSFFPTKGLGAFGDAGMLVTNEEDIYQTALSLRDFGRSQDYEHVIKGCNSRLDTLQAAVLTAKLKHLDQWNDQRREAAKFYESFLKELEEIRVPLEAPDRRHVYQNYTVCIPKRDKIAGFLKEKGIDVRILYPVPLHMQDVYRDLGYKEGDFPVSEKVSKEVMSLPIYPHISEEDLTFVCENLKELL